MKSNMFLFAALSFGLLAGCTSGTGGDQVAETSSAGRNREVASNLVQDGGERKICKVRAITGSRFKQKTCMTAEEWENMRVETQKMLDKGTRSKPTNID